MKTTDSVNIKVRKTIYGFLMMVFRCTGMMAVLFPVLFFLVSIPLQFTPQHHQIAVAIRTLRVVALISGSGAFTGFIIGFGLGFVLYILPLIHVLIKGESDDAVEIIS